MTVSVTPTTHISVGGTVTIYIPRQPVSGSDNVASPTCTNLTSNLASSISCSYNSSNAILTVSNLISSGTLSSQFKFSVSGWVNPISTAPFTGYAISTTDSSGAYIE